MTRPTRKVNNKDNLVHIIENIVNWHFCDDGVKRVVDTLQYTRVSDNNESTAKHKTGFSQGSLKGSHKNILAGMDGEAIFSQGGAGRGAHWANTGS